MTILLLLCLNGPLFARGFDVERIEVFEDKAGALTLEGAGEADFRPHAGVPNFGFTDSAVWVRFTVPEEARHSDLLQMSFPLMDHIDVYQRQGGMWQKTTAGFRLPFHSRPHPHRTFLFDLTKDSAEGAPVYMRFQNGDSMQIPLTLWQREDFRAQDHDEQFALGIYYGIVFVMALFNLFLFFTLRDRTHLLYVFYVFVFGLFLLSQYGLAYEYLWPDWNSSARRMNPFLASLLEGSILMFTRSFLRTKQNAPVLDGGMRIQIWLNGAATILAFIVPLKISALLVVGLGLTACIFVMGSAVQALRAGFRPARFFVLAFGFLLLGAVTYALKTFGLLPVNFFTTNGMQIGSGLEVTLLTLALVDRMNSMKRDAEQAQKQLIVEQQNALERQESLTASYARLLPRESLKLLGKNSILELKPGDQVERSMTVLFSDIRSFTGMSEQMTPEDTFNFLNSYLSRMNPHIRQNRGYIDKYVGDGIMALFPESSLDAIRAAAAMREELTAYNERRTDRGYAAIRTGTGIHTGPVMLGALGESERLELTAISDTVNVASRLESLTRIYGASVLISETAFQSSGNPDEFYYRLLDRVTPRGKTNSIAVYEILGGLACDELQRRLDTRHVFERGVQAFLTEQYDTALGFFLQVMEHDPDDTAAKLYAERSKKQSSGWKGGMYLPAAEGVS